MTAIEELELHVHNASMKADHAHMYLNIVWERQIYDLVPYSRSIEIEDGKVEAMAEAILNEVACEIHAYAGVIMHRLGVCE